MSGETYPDPVLCPLALCDGRVDQDLVVFEILSDRIGENYWSKYHDRHRFYRYPEMIRNEALLIKQWDSAGELARSAGRKRRSKRSLRLASTAPTQRHLKTRPIVGASKFAASLFTTSSNLWCRSLHQSCFSIRQIDDKPKSLKRDKSRAPIFDEHDCWGYGLLRERRASVWISEALAIQYFH